MLDLLLDLSGRGGDRILLTELVNHLTRPDGLAAITGRASCILPPRAALSDAPAPPNWTCVTAEDATAASSCALEAAARLRRPLVVLLGPVLAGNEPISALLEAFEWDPMFGFAIARVVNRDGELGKLSACLGDADIDWLPRAALSALPESYLIPEAVGTCFVIRPEVVSNFGALEGGFENTTGAWLHYLCRARRVGFRGIVVNQAVVEVAAGPASVTLYPDGNDYWNAHHQFPDVGLAREEFRRLPAHEHESLLARAFGSEMRKRKTLLIDARGLPPFFNGTADCILGLLDGLTECSPDWSVSVLVNPDASAFHQVSNRYPHWTSLDKVPKQRFSIALRLSQPWDVQTFVELHNIALLNFYMMLDTISWDILYNGPLNEVLETTWNLVAQYADGILYISDFTRRRFVMRFPPAPPVRHYVSYLSFHQDDYVENEIAPPRDGEYILVVGNHLDHKWVAATVELLATAFPFHYFHALGCGTLDLPNVKSLRSGDLSDIDAARLYAESRIIIFPSFYEGFGLPVVAGLNYVKAVVARRSSLLKEIAGHIRATGKLYAFSDTMELLEVVTRLLRGEEVVSMPLGAALEDGQEPWRWRDISRNMLDFIAASLRTPGQSQWLRRMQQLQLRRG